LLLGQIQNLRNGCRKTFNQHAIQRALLFIRTQIPGEAFIGDGILITSAHIGIQQEKENAPVPAGYVLIGFEHNDTLASTLSIC